MLERITWKDFRDSGCLWFINTILHLFGLALAVVLDDEGNVKEIYPARTEFRGFDTETNDKGYMKLTKYLSEHMDEIKKGAEL